ncbi:MAG TPA: choice-of-anchor J domain-containing protein, partial [Bacteroidales bacterium]|nr:choice-of-anchor J domain-containing protein [Bacteroidales bacterium]
MKKVIATLLCFVVFHFVNAQVILYESFENGFPANWLNVDADNDGFTWQITSRTRDSISAHTGDKAVATYSYDNNTYSALNPNNYLITSRLTVPSNGATLTFWRRALDYRYPREHYEVKISTTGTAVSNFTN